MQNEKSLQANIEETEKEIERCEEEGKCSDMLLFAYTQPHVKRKVSVLTCCCLLTPTPQVKRKVGVLTCCCLLTPTPQVKRKVGVLTCCCLLTPNHM